MFNLGMKFLKLYKALCILHVRQGLRIRPKQYTHNSLHMSTLGFQKPFHFKHGVSHNDHFTLNPMLSKQLFFADRDTQPRWLMKPKAHASCLEEKHEPSGNGEKKQNKLLTSIRIFVEGLKLLVLFQQGSGSFVSWSSALQCLGVCVWIWVCVCVCALALYWFVVHL